MFRVQGLGFRVMVCTWTPKVCKILALVAAIMSLGLLFYIWGWGFGAERFRAAIGFSLEFNVWSVWRGIGGGRV